MMPGRRRSAATTSAHPEARYFGVGRIEQRPGRGLRPPQGHEPRRMERWLAPNLAYDPDLRDG